MRENYRGKLHPDADIDTVGESLYIKAPADVLHPLAARPTHGNDNLGRGKTVIACIDRICTVLIDSQTVGIAVEPDIDLILELLIKMPKDLIILVGPEMPYRCIEQMKPVLKADLLERSACSGIELSPFTAVRKIDLVYIFHEFKSGLFADMVI